MTSNPHPVPATRLARSHRGWVLLALALAWAGLVRVPLVLDAKVHLDSDLAVDGLTLVDALQGRWRWHYPATPFIGSPPVLLSWVQAKVWGPGPEALVSGGVAAYGLVVVGTYLLNRRAFGPRVAAWGLVPLAFASTGAIWLSGRVTGGHLLAAAWHAGAFVLLRGALVEGGWRRAAGLGLWCGFGLYVDSMFAVTWAGLAIATCAYRRLPSSSALPPGEGPGVRGVARRVGSKEAEPRSEVTGRVTPLTPGPSPGGKGEQIFRMIGCLLAFAAASGLGVAPRLIGTRVDPHDAYEGQFEPNLRADHVASNARILLLDGLPRLIAGHRLPGLQAEPEPSKFGRGSPSTKGVPWLALAVAVVSLGLFGRSMIALATGGRIVADPASSAIRLGLLASMVAVVAGFLVHPSIANSDHYRYLVTWLVPWSSGFGLMMARSDSKGRLGAWALATSFAALMTVDSARWYEGLGWVDPSGRPVRQVVDDPALAWLEDHLEVSAILGDYWDVYRLSYLTLGRVAGVPFPQYPDRFPEARRAFPTLPGRVVVVRGGPFGPLYRGRALAGGGREWKPARGLSIVGWPEGMAP